MNECLNNGHDEKGDLRSFYSFDETVASAERGLPARVKTDFPFNSCSGFRFHAYDEKHQIIPPVSGNTCGLIS
jgi:hypothetical protein